MGVLSFAINQITMFAAPVFYVCFMKEPHDSCFFPVDGSIPINAIRGRNINVLQ